MLRSSNTVAPTTPRMRAEQSALPQKTLGIQPIQRFSGACLPDAQYGFPYEMLQELGRQVSVTIGVIKMQYYSVHTSRDPRRYRSGSKSDPSKR